MTTEKLELITKWFCGWWGCGLERGEKRVRKQCSGASGELRRQESQSSWVPERHLGVLILTAWCLHLEITQFTLEWRRKGCKDSTNKGNNWVSGASEAARISSPGAQEHGHLPEEARLEDTTSVRVKISGPCHFVRSWKFSGTQTSNWVKWFPSIRPRGIP